MGVHLTLKKLMEHLLSGKWGHRILLFNQTYLDKWFSEIDLTSRELEKLSVTKKLIKLYIFKSSGWRYTFGEIRSKTLPASVLVKFVVCSGIQDHLLY